MRRLRVSGALVGYARTLCVRSLKRVLHIVDPQADRGRALGDAGTVPATARWQGARLAATHAAGAASTLYETASVGTKKLACRTPRSHSVTAGAGVS